MCATKNYLLPSKKNKWKGVTKFWRKTLVAKIDWYFSDQSKKLNQVTMIQTVSKKLWVTHELQGTDMSSTNKGACTSNSKKGCCINGKKDLEESLRWKTFLGKTCSLFPKEYSE